MKRLVLGVIGHVDHGKTALVGALTGMQTDRLVEERRRGISIALGFAHLPLESGAVIDLIDMPGHERFIRTMIAGASGIDAVLLVVSAAEGVKPQTREHVDIAALLGVRQAVVAVTKCDLAQAGEAQAAGRAGVALAVAAGMRVQGPVLTCALHGTGMEELRTIIGSVVAGATEAADDGFAYLPIDRGFSVAGHGTVVTGTLRRGGLAVGAELRVMPGGAAVRVRGLQVHGGAVSTAEPGQRVAVNLRGVELTAVPRGAALCVPEVLSGSEWLSVELRAVEGAPALATGMRLRLLFGTSEIEARLRLLDRDVLAAGERTVAQLRCATAVAVPARERFVLRIASPALTVAGGRVLDPDTGRQRRGTAGVLERLRGLAEAAPEEIVKAELVRAGAQGAALPRLARVAGISPARAAAALAGSRAIVTRAGLAVAEDALAGAAERLAGVLRGQAEGVSREALGRLAPAVGAAVLDAAVERLIKGGVVRVERGLVAVVRPGWDRQRLADEAAAAQRMLAALLQAGLTPPDAAVLAPDAAARRLLERLVRQGAVIKAADRVQQRELYFHPAAVEAARRLLAPRLGGAGLLVREAGEVLGVSRKFSVPLLEYLDGVNFTRRVSERRVLAQIV